MLNNNLVGKRGSDQLVVNPSSKKSKLGLPSSINFIRSTGENKEIQNIPNPNNNEFVNANQFSNTYNDDHSSSSTVVRSVSSFLIEERLTHEFTEYYLELMKNHDLMEQEMDKKTKKELKKEFMNECALLVIGYFNQFLNGKKIVYGEAADVQDDGKMTWHAKLINRGGFGSVLRVTKRNENTYEIEGVRAIKVVPRNIMGQSEAMKSVQLGSNFVVKVFNVFMIRQMSCIEMEFLEEGSLKDLIANKETIPTSTFCKMLHQCSEVLARMRQLNMVHNDIKPDNIMIQNKQFDIAVGDFGLSFNDQLLIETTKGGTRGYIAPEVLNDSEQLSFFSDLFSLGVTFEKLYECTDNNVKLYEIIKQLQSKAPREREKAFYKFNSEWIFQRKEISQVWQNDVVLISTIFDKFNISYLEDTIGFSLINETLKKNLDFITEYNLFRMAHPSLHKDRRFLLGAAKAGVIIETELPDDRDFVIDIVKLNGGYFRYANEILRADREFVLEVIKQFHYAFDYIAEHLKEERDFIIDAVSLNGKVLSCPSFSREFLKDKEIVTKAINQFGDLLFHADKSFRSDGEMVLTAVKNMTSAVVLSWLGVGGSFLDQIDESLRTNREIVYEILSKRGLELNFVIERFKADKQMVLTAVKQNGMAIRYTTPSFRYDEQIVLEAVKSDPLAFQYSSIQTKEIVLEVVKGGYWEFSQLSEQFRADREIVLAAVKKDGTLLEYVHETLKSDEEIIQAASYKKTNIASEFLSGFDWTSEMSSEPNNFI